MTRASIRNRLSAAFPLREVTQPRASELAFPAVFSQSTLGLPQAENGGGAASSGSAILQAALKQASDAVTQNNKQLTDLQNTQQQLLASTNQSIQALNSNTAAKSSGSTTVSTLGNIASGIFGQGSLLSPLISGLMSLFGGSDSKPAPVLTPYIAPSSVQLQTVIGAASPQPTQNATPTLAPSTRGTSATAQVQVQVNAIDSRSFLDHSDAIAEAVRQALLNSHSLGDVIAEL